MKILVNFLLNPITLIVFVNIVVFLVALPRHKSRLKWGHLLQLIIFNSSVLYAASFGVPLTEMSRGTWVTLFFVLLWPIILYRMGVAFISIFLLPIELQHWKEWAKAAKALISFARGINFPYYGYNDETEQLEPRLGGVITSKRGGPGLIMLRPEHAVILHRGSELTRVASGDIVFTERLEGIFELVDLRMHIMVILDVESVTKDGIWVKFHVFVPCCIDQTRISTGQARLYSFEPNNVLKVARELNMAANRRLDWYELVVQKAKNSAFDVVASYTLDRLYVGEDPTQIPRDELRARIQTRLTTDMVGSGIEIIGVGIGNIEPSDPGVKEQWVMNWQARWQRRAAERAARGEAKGIRIMRQVPFQALNDLDRSAYEDYQENEG